MAENREWLDISAAEYHALDAISSGGLRMYEKVSPLEYYVTYVSRTKKSPGTTATKLGTAFHAAMEDPSAWEDAYRVISDTLDDEAICDVVNVSLDASGSGSKRANVGDTLNRRLPAHKMYEENLAADAAAQGQELITHDQLEIIRRQVDAVYDSPACRDYVGRKTSSNVEMACVYNTDLSKPAKALCDLVLPECIVDFKTTKALNPHQFLRDALDNHGYQYQAAHYLYVTGFTEFRFITVTSEAVMRSGSPCEANVWFVPDYELERAKVKNLQTMRTICDHFSHDDEYPPQLDSQGVPFHWHNEGYGAMDPLPMDRAAFANDPSEEVWR